MSNKKTVCKENFSYNTNLSDAKEYLYTCVCFLKTMDTICMWKWRVENWNGSCGRYAEWESLDLTVLQLSFTPFY